jgi:hypothetical protein
LAGLRPERPLKAACFRDADASGDVADLSVVVITSQALGA